MRKSVILFIFIVLIFTSISSCGVKQDPLPPEWAAWSLPVPKKIYLPPTRDRINL